ncbi:hypothetical protein J2X31_001828 [Flavobacterium arsenatis]|uniref:Uncharacterized protein n=1 Tax=Flavobacterium arsenatis TaxID=1484332 RepID=A0ABU1TPE1_9FLAO|nr:hypothetical protein [Flavobacterium arsenatis]MDR6967816.1 hypothetical protein [Flavobacterium arsenatis]
MAKNTGLIKFTGKLGNLSARETQYGNIISTPGGFNGDRIRTEERYEATRQLGTEFGRCSKIASQLYSTLTFYLQTLPHPHMYGYIQSLITNIKGCDANSPKGERSFGIGLQTEQGRKMLHHFSFNPKRNLQSVMMQQYDVGLETGKLVLPGFNIQKISFPKSARKLGLQLVLLRLDTETPICRMETSTLFLISPNDENTTIRLEACVPEGKGVLIALLYFGFCSETNGEVYFLKHPKNVLEVVGFL